MPDPSCPVCSETTPGRAGAMRRGLAWAAGVSIVVYYNVDLLSMAAHTLIPFAALLVVGLVLGLSFPRNASAASGWAWALVVAAAVFRRIQLLHVPLASQIFGGVLAMGGYPPWAAWLAECLRLGAYGAALRLGVALGSRLRRRRAEGAR